jgi:hypothetical protein
MRGQRSLAAWGLAGGLLLGTFGLAYSSRLVLTLIIGASLWVSVRNKQEARGGGEKRGGTLPGILVCGPAPRRVMHHELCFKTRGHSIHAGP